MTDAEDRRTLILVTAAGMFARKGIKSTTVREIADAVGVLSGSLYHYFDSKDAMVAEILKGFLDAIRARYGEVLAQGGDAVESLRGLVSASLLLARDQPDATAIYQNELRYLRETSRFGEVQAASGEVQRVWLDVIQRGVADGSFRDDIAPRVFYRLIRDAVWLTGRRHHDEAGYPSSELADAIASILLDGFSAATALNGSRPGAAAAEAAT